MWHQVGFLADAFQVFKQHGLVGRSGIDLGDQCHGIGGPDRQHLGRIPPLPA